MKKGKKVVISGPSGVGKGSVNETLFRDKKLNLVYSVSMTTRKARPGENDGVNYFFVERDDFENAIQNNELIEHAEFIGNYYGTPRKYVDQQTENGKNVVLEIEVEGATQVIKNEDNVLSIFLMPPSLYELQNRIMGRATESREVIKKRLTKALFEIPLKDNYQYVVENDTIPNAVSKITDILKKEGVTDYEEPSVYETVKKYTSEILDEEYELFMEIIKDNLDKLAEVKGINKTIGTMDSKQRLVDLLADEVYYSVLSHGCFDDLKDKDKVNDVIKQLMLGIDFFGIKSRKIN